MEYTVDELRGEARAYRALCARPDAPGLTVAVCGVFSSGKTSLMNALLKSDFRLPTGLNPVTKAVTRISYAETLGFAVRRGALETPVSREQALSIATGRAPACEDALLCVKMPSKLLENGVVLLDTPGFLDEMGGELEMKSRDAVAGADMALFCMNAAQTGLQFERDYIGEVRETVGSCILAVNRMDNLNTDEDFETVKRKAAWLTRDGGGPAARFAGADFFLTVAAGAYRRLSGLDAALEALFSNEAQMREVRLRARSLREARAREALAGKLARALACAARDKADCESALAREADRLLARRQAGGQKLCQTVEDCKPAVKRALADLIARVQAALAPLFSPNDFINRAVSAIAPEVRDTARRMGALAEEQNLGARADVEKAVARAAWDGGFQVCAPAMSKVLRRGAVERTLVTLAGAVLSQGGPDDGCDTETNSFQALTLDSFVQNAIPAMWRAFADTARARTEALYPVEPDRAPLRALAADVCALREMLREIQGETLSR